MHFQTQSPAASKKDEKKDERKDEKKVEKKVEKKDELKDELKDVPGDSRPASSPSSRRETCVQLTRRDRESSTNEILLGSRHGSRAQPPLRLLRSYSKSDARHRRESRAGTARNLPTHVRVRAPSPRHVGTGTTARI